MILFTSSIYRSNEAPVDIDVTFHSPLTASRRQTVCKLLTVLDCLVLTYQGQICVCVCLVVLVCMSFFFLLFLLFHFMYSALDHMYKRHAASIGISFTTSSAY